MNAALKRVLSEPLLHFLLIGATLFGAYAMLHREATPGGEQVVVTAGQVEHLATTFAKVWQRPPSAQELKGLIDDYVTEEVLSREAIKLGLDQNDTIIRRRLQQKMEFIAEDFAATAEPTEAELEAYLGANPENFREPPRFTFRHVYLSDDRGERLQSDADSLLGQLTADPACDSTALGDRFLGAIEFTNEPWQGVASQLGSDFATQLNAVPVGLWAGPIRSAFGAHLVLMTERTEGRLPPLAEARDQVKRDLVAARRKEAHQAFLDALLAKYQVRIDLPTGDASAGATRVSLVQ
jgi:hypothetical protein